MLIEFTVGNYKSIKDKVTLSMVASKVKAEDPKVDENNTFIVDKKLTLLKSAAIYGANASGKTNVLQALRFLMEFVRDSSTSKQANEKIDVVPFSLSTETENKPSLFEIVIVIGKTKYRYGFEATRNTVVSEWLYQSSTAREALLFERRHSELITRAKFRTAHKLQRFLRKNALFLSLAAQFNIDLAVQFLNGLSFFFVNVSENTAAEVLTNSLLQENGFRQRIVDFIRDFDTGIADLRVGESVGDVKQVTPAPGIPNLNSRYRVVLNKSSKEKNVIAFQEHKGVIATHSRFDGAGHETSKVDFDLKNQESAGTQKLYALSSVVIFALHIGALVVIDELDASLHPIITQKVVQLFNSNATNPNNAQLVFATHDTNLLSKDLFRRDQIWFTEKDKFGATQLYSLVEYKPRNDASFEKNYIEGKYGAIPFVGDLSRIVGSVNEKK